MPTPTLHFDRVEGAMLEATATQKRLVRTGWVQDFEIASSSDAEVLVRIMDLDGFPQFHSSLGSTYSDYLLERVRVVPSQAKLSRVFFELTYSIDPVTPLGYLIRDYSKAVTVQTQRIANKWIKVAYTVDDAGNTPEGPDKITVSQNVTLSIYRPMRSISVTKIVSGEPSDADRNKIGMVNNATWKGLSKGYWLLTEVGSDLSRYEGYYTFTMSASSMVHEDWSTFGVLFNERTGKYVTVADSDLATLTEGDYAYGITYPGDSDQKGIVKVGPYPLTDFEALFGFGSGS